MWLGVQPMPTALAALVFHSVLLVHYALIKRFPSRSPYSSTLAVLSLLLFSVYAIPGSAFFAAYMRVVAVLFSMQIIRLEMDPSWASVLKRLSLRSYLLRVISFGSAEQSVAAEKGDPLSFRMVLIEALVMLLKYLLINAIHVYYFYYPYRREPTVRGLLPLDIRSFLEYYLLAIQLFLYMSFYYAFSFGLFALLCGRLSPPVFNAPLLASSPREFWSKRWNMLFKQCLHDLIFVPTLRLADYFDPPKPDSSPSLNHSPKSQSPSRKRRSPSPRRSLWPKPAASHLKSTPIARHPLVALLAGQMTFMFSGIMHEYFLYDYWLLLYSPYGERATRNLSPNCSSRYVIFQRSPTWENLLFFNLHGILCLLQVIAERALPSSVRRAFPTWLGMLLTTLGFVYISPLFFNIFLRVDALNDFHLPLLLPIYNTWCLNWVQWPRGA